MPHDEVLRIPLPMVAPVLADWTLAKLALILRAHSAATLYGDAVLPPRAPASPDIAEAAEETMPPIREPSDRISPDLVSATETALFICARSAASSAEISGAASGTMPPTSDPSETIPAAPSAASLSAMNILIATAGGRPARFCDAIGVTWLNAPPKALAMFVPVLSASTPICT